MISKICYINKIILELQDEVEADGNADILQHLLFLQNVKTKDFKLESYESSPPQIAITSNNIIQIDSDSDLGLFSSFESSIMGVDDLDVVHKVMNPSLCSEELKHPFTGQRSIISVNTQISRKNVCKILYFGTFS